MIKKILVWLVIIVIFTPGLFAQLKYLNLSPTDFRPATSGQNYCVSSEKLYHTGGSSSTYYAPVYLPHGAVIKNVMICYEDFDPGFLDVTMFRKKCSVGIGVDQMFYCPSPGNTSGTRKKTIWATDIDHRQIYTGAYSYCVRIFFSDVGSNLKIHGIRIAYELN